MSQRQRWRRIIVWPLAAALIVFSLYAAYCGILRRNGNFGTVEAGKLYRSGQLDKNSLRDAIKHYGLRSILNLRGTNKGTWYRDEIAVSHELGVIHYDYRLSPNEIANPHQIDEILQLLVTAPKPLLVHCSAGSDRTGLVSAIYVFAVNKIDAVTAATQLSLLYGHFPYLTSRTGAMDQSFWIYVRSHAQLADGKAR